MDDTRQSYRFKLGPVVSGPIDDLPEQSPAALDTKNHSLVDHVADLEKRLEASRDTNRRLGDSLDALGQALAATLTGVSLLHRYTDERMRDLCGLLIHFGANLGNHFATTEPERKRYERRMGEIEERAQTRFDALAQDMATEHHGRDRMIAALTAKVEEDRLSFISDRAKESRAMGRER